VRNAYTVADCLVLRRLLEEHYFSTDSLITVLKTMERYNAVTGFDTLLVNLRKAIQNISDCSPTVEKELLKWIKTHYRFKRVDVHSKKVIHFVFEEPLDEAPLQINDEVLGLFARWRLSIAK
jgi:hypothetical protein